MSQARNIWLALVPRCNVQQRLHPSCSVLALAAVQEAIASNEELNDRK